MGFVTNPVRLQSVIAVRNVLKSNIPIEVMFAGDNDLHPRRQRAIETLGDNIVAVDILNIFDENIVGLKGGGWAIKPFAALASSFQQIIIADADAVFLQPPEAVFSQPAYHETGTLFFHDRIIPGRDDWHVWWHSVMACRNVSSEHMKSSWWHNATMYEMESGVVAFDKNNRSVLLGLLFVAWMNTRSIREITTYVYSHGELQHASLVDLLQASPHCQ